MFRVVVVLIAALSALSRPGHAQVLFGGGLEAGAAQTKVSKYKEVDKKGSTYAVQAGLSLFPTESSVLTATLGFQAFSVAGRANKRTQRIKTGLGVAQLDYAFMLEGFEPGLLVRLNYGNVATLLAADKDEKQLTASVGPKFGYRWDAGGSDLVTYVAATFDPMAAEQTKRAILLGASYWIGRDDPAGSSPEPVATAELPPEAPKAAPEVTPLAEPATPVAVPESFAVEGIEPPDHFRIRPDVFQFEVNSVALTPASSVKAKKLAKALGGMAVAWTVIEASGHSDANSKNPTRNQEVSELRAAAVRDLLIASGVDAGSITVKGHGASEPLPGVDPTSPRNRRVEVSLTGVPDPAALAAELQEFVLVEK